MTKLPKGCVTNEASKVPKQLTAAFQFEFLYFLYFFNVMWQQTLEAGWDFHSLVSTTKADKSVQNQLLLSPE
jgi:hypothetical protein